MYPLVKNGDIVVYKMINDLENGIFWGEMHILYIDGDEMLTVKYVHLSEKPDHIKLVSQNSHHQPKEIHCKFLKAAARVTAVINYRSIV